VTGAGQLKDPLVSLSAQTNDVYNAWSQIWLIGKPTVITDWSRRIAFVINFTVKFEFWPCQVTDLITEQLLKLFSVKLLKVVKLMVPRPILSLALTSDQTVNDPI